MSDQIKVTGLVACKISSRYYPIVVSIKYAKLNLCAHCLCCFRCGTVVCLVWIPSLVLWSDCGKRGCTRLLWSDCSEGKVHWTKRSVAVSPSIYFLFTHTAPKLRLQHSCVNLRFPSWWVTVDFHCRFVLHSLPTAIPCTFGVATVHQRKSRRPTLHRNIRAPEMESRPDTPVQCRDESNEDSVRASQALCTLC